MTTTISRPAIEASAPTGPTPGGANDTQQANINPAPLEAVPAGADTRPAEHCAIPTVSVPGGANDTQQAITIPAPLEAAPAGEDSRPAMSPATSSAPAPGGANAAQDPATRNLPPTARSTLLDPVLALAADVLDDLERVRTANQNRLRQLTRSVEDSDGELRGFGLDETHPDVARLAAMVTTLEKIEHDATLQLQRQLRRHPLSAWIKAQRGIGEKQAARLLATIGDPYINSAKGEPRTVSALWAYCGLHVLPASSHAPSDTHRSPAAGRAQLPTDPTGTDTRGQRVGGSGGDPGQGSHDTQNGPAGVAPKRQRGQRANWSTNAKMRSYLIAVSCMKQPTGSTYRDIYDHRRAHTATTHPDWTPGHSHNDALRIVSKAILRDLWREAKRIHDAA